MPKKPTTYYSEERKRARIWSGILHGVYLLLAIFGLPNFLMPKAPVEPFAVSVEILPITGVTNVKPSDAPLTQQALLEQKQQAQKKVAPPPKPKEPKPVAEQAPVEKRKEKPQPKPEDKKPEPKKEEKKKPAEDPFKKLLNDLSNQTNKPPKEKVDKNNAKTNAGAPKAHSNQYDPSMPMSMSEMDAIVSQIAKCWNPPIGAKDAQNLVPVLMAEYNSDGSLISVEPADEIKPRYDSDSYFRAAVDSAIRATKKPPCNVLKGLPPEKYDTWRLLEIRFDPKFMLN